ncbi:MAG: DoxX family membrane protein [Thermanaeromonas sp.]|uniref:TQO small subunit DoxD n=1 Tax=Thermanaeromonas sp. TaxID=2003697 RepID=UPI00243C16E2|nr:TQO small subunit DoxD [Thermanaeromonas sp.]MCG0277102.1 DoxX family membrane protein [Thermanaeromonas sp.]
MLSILRNPRLAPLWTLLRIWLGWQWLEAGLHKISDPKWMQGGEALKGFWAKAVGALPNTQPAIKYGWYKAFIQGLLDGGHYTWFSKLVVFGELLTGIALILGVATVFALAVGAFMNLNFMLAGTASTNPVLYTVAILLLLAGQAAYQYGIDRYLLPYIQQMRRKEAVATRT